MKNFPNTKDWKHWILIEEDSDAILDEYLVENIGIETLGGEFTKLLTVGQMVPVNFSQTFSTADDNQPAVSIKLYRSVSTKVSNSIFLGTLIADNIPPSPRGVPQINVHIMAVQKCIYVFVDGYKNLSVSFDKNSIKPKLKNKIEVEANKNIIIEKNKQDSKKISPCLICEQKIRFDTKNKSAIYTCPKCRTDFHLDSYNNLQIASTPANIPSKKNWGKEIQDIFVEESEESIHSFSSAHDELESLTGLSRVKNEVNDLIDFIKVQNERRKAGKKTPEISKHLVFIGNPGTGKTTVARIIGRIYYQLGICKSEKVVETDRSSLVAEYIGQTAIKTKGKITEALGGILFIDEAYALSPKDSIRDFGTEAIETLLKEMEDNRHNLVVIVAGYKDEMEYFIKSNPGLESRFNRTIEFDDYSPEEMLEIFKANASSNEYNVTPKALKLLLSYFNQIYAARDSSFANARTVRNIFEGCIKFQARRTSPLIGKVLNTDLSTIDEQDIKNVIERS